MKFPFIDIFFPPPEAITDYSLRNLILMFFIFSFVGWVWEVIYIAVTEKVVAKRGMLHGPWLPLYGIGGVIILETLSQFRHSPVLVFVLAMLTCGTLEYFTGVAVEHFFGCRWWDYSTKRINYKGRICLSGIVLFGVSGTVAVCGVGPMLNSRIAGLDHKIYTALMAVLILAFVFDLIFSAKNPNSGKGITYDIYQKETENSTEEAHR